MASPFPGMDPYLENPAHWSDFHVRFINYWCEALMAALPAHYTARIGERVYLVEGPPPSQRRISPDVALERQPGRRHPFRLPVRLPPPCASLLPCRTLHWTSCARPTSRSCTDRIVRCDGDRIALSREQGGTRTNQYLRAALLVQNVHVVELDLLLGGHAADASASAEGGLSRLRDPDGAPDRTATFIRGCCPRRYRRCPFRSASPIPTSCSSWVRSLRPCISAAATNGK